MDGGRDQQLSKVYAALADPTRRAILARLAGGEINVGDLATRFPISLNGVSKHIKVLEHAGLVHREVRGREHRLQLRAEPLRDAAAWFQHYREFWSARLDALEALVREESAAAGDRPAARPTKRAGRRHD